MNKVRELFEATMKWEEARQLALEIHPGWVYLAEQTKRPALRRIYRKKVLELYSQLNWDED
jgi:hypothetical protein